VAAIDTYIEHMGRLNARALVFESGKNITVRLASGDRPAGQSITHEMLTAMLEEFAPPGELASLLTDGKAQFDYASASGKPFAVSVEVSGGKLKLTLASGAAAPELASAGIELDRAPPPSARSVYRTQRTGSAGAPPEPAPASDTVAAPTPPPVTPPPVMATPAAPPGEPAEIDQLLMAMKKMGASDLHMSCTMPPMVRQHGEIKPIPGFDVLTPERMVKLLYEITPEKNRKEFEERSDTDFAYAIPKVSRFRANMFRDRHGPGAVFRAIPFQILSAEQLGLPAKVLDLCYLTKGLVVVTGPTGSGKSTTLATLIDYINQHRSDHLITIEDPIEFVHENKKCLVNQREVHVHTRSFKDALRAALREDPDIVLVGEMRDLETIAIAVETAETGHLVFGTLHTTTAPSTVDRIIDQFPADRQSQIRQMLAESLKGVIAQTLCKKIGGGRAAAYEILIGTSAVSNLIRQAKTFQLFSTMQTSRHLGMTTLNDSLLEHVKAKRVEPMEAYMKAVNKGEFKTMLGKLGIEINVQEDKE
jgi:twitching motility protein PilT